MRPTPDVGRLTALFELVSVRIADLKRDILTLPAREQPRFNASVTILERRLRRLRRQIARDQRVWH
jgi:hypothetical protein